MPINIAFVHASIRCDELIDHRPCQTIDIFAGSSILQTREGRLDGKVIIFIQWLAPYCQLKCGIDSELLRPKLVLWNHHYVNGFREVHPFL